jgi:uncharacterized membrane protein YfhO
VQLSGQVLSSKVAIDAECVGCLAVPYSEGWRVTVDGTAVETFRADYGFVGFVLEPGTHTVEARFVPQGLLVGGAAAAVGVVLAVVACVSTRRRQQVSGGHFAL